MWLPIALEVSVSQNNWRMFSLALILQDLLQIAGPVFFKLKDHWILTTCICDLDSFAFLIVFVLQQYSLRKQPFLLALRR